MEARSRQGGFQIVQAVTREVTYCRERRAEIARAAFPDAVDKSETDGLSFDSEETAMRPTSLDKQQSEADDDSDASETVTANLHSNPFALGSQDDEVH